MPLNPFGAKADLDVTTDNVVYAPGDLVNATVGVRGTKELTIEEGRIELHYEHWYR